MKWLVFALIIVNVAMLLFSPSKAAKSNEFSKQVDPQRVKLLSALELAKIKTDSSVVEVSKNEIKADEQNSQTTTTKAKQDKAALASATNANVSNPPASNVNSNTKAKVANETVNVSKANPNSSLKLSPQVARVCYSWGSFDQNQLNQLTPELETINASYKLNTQKESERYWVYLEPLANNNIAQQKSDELKAKGFDALVLRTGEEMNGISIGLFTKKNLADNLMTRLKNEGFEPKLKLRGGTSFVLRFELDNQTSRRLETLARKYPGTPLKKQSCS